MSVNWRSKNSKAVLKHAQSRRWRVYQASKPREAFGSCSAGIPACGFWRLSSRQFQHRHRTWKDFAVGHREPAGRNACSTENAASREKSGFEENIPSFKGNEPLVAVKSYQRHFDCAAGIETVIFQP